MGRKLLLGALLAAGVLAAGPAVAEDPTPAPRPSIMLDIIGSPPPSRQSAIDESIMTPPPPPPAMDGVVQPDGSVRYGSGRTSVTIGVTPSCPPGAGLYEPRMLPGRRPRN